MNNDLEQFSEERLKKISSSAFYYAGCEINEIQALARIALAAKQAKPVAWKVTTTSGSIVFHTEEQEMEGHSYYGNTVTPLYTTPQPAHTEQVIPDGWKLVPIEPTDEQLRLMLAARYPATFREHLRNPLNGPKSRVEAEVLIVEVTNQYKNALSAAPKPESEL